jgi:hypothetical protein
MAPETRRWKYAFEPDCEIEAAPKYPANWSKPQIRWLEKAWKEFFKGHIPNAIPILTSTGWKLNRANGDIEWHHIRPSGISVKKFREDPNYPENAVPLPKKLHTGPREDAIHPDIAQAKADYPDYLLGIIANPFAAAATDRSQLAKLGITYWESGWDTFFGHLADVVVAKYKARHPENPWPRVTPRLHE